MRRKPTEAQKAAAHERRQRFRAMVKHVADMEDGERLRLASRMQVVSCDGGTAYSAHNQCLLAIQSPGATICGGFRQWKRNGRSVRKGEHGHMIWIPKFAKKDEDEAETSKPDEVRFLAGTVFDVAQTDDAAFENHNGYECANILDTLTPRLRGGEV